MKVNVAHFRSLVVNSIVIFAAIMGIYHGALQEKLISPDELTALTFVLTNPSPLLDFVQPAFGFASKYRPLASIWTWGVYELFGVNYAGYQLLAMLVLFLCAVLMLKLAYRLTRNSWIALTIPLLFVTHPFVSDQWNWPLDTGILNTAFAIFSSIFLLGRFKRRFPILVFLVLLALSLFSRETGFVVIGGIALYTEYGLFSRVMPRREAGGLLLGCLSVVALYTVIRVNALGLSAQKFQTLEEGGVLFTFYSAAQIAGFGWLKRFLFFAYNSIGHVLSNFFPVLTPCGLLWWEPVLVGTLLVGVGAGALFLVVRKHPPSRLAQSDSSLTLRARLYLASAFLLATILLLILARVFFGTELLALANAIQIAISIGMMIAVLKYSTWTRQHKLIALFALGIILSTAVIGYSYFRYRISHVSVVGWFILLLVTLANLNTGVWQSALKTLMIVLILNLTLVNALRVQSGLPFPGSVPISSSVPPALCDRAVSAELAYAVAKDAGIDLAEVEHCRSGPRRSPASPGVNPIQNTPPRMDVYRCGRTF